MAKINPEIRRILKIAIAKLQSHTPIDAAYLFGSYANGTANEMSDIDIAVFGPKVGKMKVDKKITIIARVQMELDAPVEIHLFDSTCLNKARPTNLFGVIVETGNRIF